jgi:hypothetical protein
MTTRGTAVDLAGHPDVAAAERCGALSLAWSFTRLLLRSLFGCCAVVAGGFLFWLAAGSITTGAAQMSPVSTASVVTVSQVTRGQRTDPSVLPNEPLVSLTNASILPSLIPGGGGGRPPIDYHEDVQKASREVNARRDRDAAAHLAEGRYARKAASSARHKKHKTPGDGSAAKRRTGDGPARKGDRVHAPRAAQPKKPGRAHAVGNGQRHGKGRYLHNDRVVRKNPYGSMRNGDIGIVGARRAVGIAERAIRAAERGRHGGRGRARGLAVAREVREVLAESGILRNHPARGRLFGRVGGYPVKKASYHRDRRYRASYWD